MAITNRIKNLLNSQGKFLPTAKFGSGELKNKNWHIFLNFVATVACIYVCTYVHMYVRVYLGIYVRMYACMYMCTYICMYSCMYACMHSFMPALTYALTSVSFYVST